MVILGGVDAVYLCRFAVQQLRISTTISLNHTYDKSGEIIAACVLCVLMMYGIAAAGLTDLALLDASTPSSTAPTASASSSDHPHQQTRISSRVRTKKSSGRTTWPDMALELVHRRIAHNRGKRGLARRPWRLTSDHRKNASRAVVPRPLFPGVNRV